MVWFMIHWFRIGIYTILLFKIELKPIIYGWVNELVYLSNNLDKVIL